MNPFYDYLMISVHGKKNKKCIFGSVEFLDDNQRTGNDFINLEGHSRITSHLISLTWIENIELLKTLRTGSVEFFNYN